MTSDVAATAPETAAANGHGDAHSTAGFKALAARQHRRRLRRYRHQPALRVARGRDRGRRSRRDIRRSQGGARRSLPDPVGADRRRDAEIRADPAARRQQRRGRHAGADGAGPARGRQPRRRDRAARHHQRRAVLRRRGDHAGAVGAFGDRRHQARHRGVRSLCRAADGDHPGGAVCGSVARHRARRGLLRTGDVHLVRRHRDRGRSARSCGIPRSCLRSIRFTPSRS